MLAPIGPVPTETGPPLTVGAGTEMLGMDTDGSDEVVLGTDEVVGTDEEAVEVFETDVDDDDVAAAARAVIVFVEAGSVLEDAVAVELAMDVAGLEMTVWLAGVPPALNATETKIVMFPMTIFWISILPAATVIFPTETLTFPTPADTAPIDAETVGVLMLGSARGYNLSSGIGERSSRSDSKESRLQTSSVLDSAPNGLRR